MAVGIGDFSILIDNDFLFYGILVKGAHIIVLNVFLRIDFFIDRYLRLCDNTVLKDSQQRIGTVWSIHGRIGENGPLHRKVIFMSSFVCKPFNTIKAKWLPYSGIVFRHNKHTLYRGITAPWYVRTCFGRNGHLDFIDNIFWLIIAATHSKEGSD